MDNRSVLRGKWLKLVSKNAEDKTDELSGLQLKFKRQLLSDIKEFQVVSHVHGFEIDLFTFTT